MSQDDEGALEACQEERNQFKTLYFDLLTQSRTLLQVKNPLVLIHNDVNNAIIEPQLGVKLLVIKLSTFDDSYERWIKFRDTFQSMIDDNPKLINIQKFHYLESYG